MQHLIGGIDKSQEPIPQLNSTIKALILDDSIFDRRRIRRLAQDTQLAIDLTEVSSISALPDALDASRFDVIFLDYVLPRGDGIDALELVRSHHENGRCATIMLTGDDRSDVAVNSLRNGCTDYAYKGDLTSGTLRERIIQAIEIEAGQCLGSGFARAQVETMAEATAREYTNMLQPQLAHIIRDLRAILADSACEPERFVQELKGIEMQCMNMWAILLDTGTTSGGKKITH